MKNTLGLLLLLSVALFVNAQPKLVGTLSYTGAKNGGSVFRANLPGTSPGIIYSFDNLSPHYPLGGVTAGNADWLYGLMLFNGTDNNGALYKIRRDGTSFTKLYDVPPHFGMSAIPYYHTDGMIYFSTGSELRVFNPATNAVINLGLNLNSSTRTLTIDSDDWIYLIGQGPDPTIAKIKTDGSQWTSLYTVSGATQGSYARAGLTEIPGDTLFGVLGSGGTNDKGTIFSIKKDGTGFTVHHHFADGTGTYPESQLVYFDGKLFGTTQLGGTLGNGVLYTINADGTGYRVLHNFLLTGPDNLYGNIHITSNGRIFGTVNQFVNFAGNWRAYKVDTSGENFEHFMGVDQRQHGHYNQDLLFVDDETFFLTAAEMGRHDGGAITQFDTLGMPTTANHHFGMSPNGFRPNPVIKSTNGKLYGVNSIGGTTGNGVIYSLNADGTGFTKLHEFSDAEGYEPTGKLFESPDGRLYGTLRWGGPSGSGALYRIDKTGANFQVVYSFPLANEGYSPTGSLVEDASGVLYGTTFYSTAGNGTVFKINRNGTGFTVLHTFNTGLVYPQSGLTLHNSYLYGATINGGAENEGGIYRIRTNGTGYQILHEFSGLTSGANPIFPPLMASNGKLFGVTYTGGAFFEGTLYMMDSTGSNFTTVHEFNSAVDGSYPNTKLIQASDGRIYGALASGGVGQGGLVFRIDTLGANFTQIASYAYDTQGQILNSLLDLNGDFVLPVEFISFNAEPKAQSVLLTWRTAQEENSDRFEIERKTATTNFISIGQVRSAGNSSTVTSYSFSDDQPVNGTNYYRIKQIDIDGKFTYTTTIPVNFSILDKITLSPNPVIDRLQLQLPITNKFKSIRIVDASAKAVLQQAIETGSGSVQINTSHLPKGWYVLQLIGEKTEQLVFVKQ